MKPPSTVEARVAEELRNWLSSELEQLDASNTNQFAHHVVTILLHEDLDIEDEPLSAGDDFLRDIYSIRKSKTRDKQKKAAVQFLRSAVCCNDPVEAEIQGVVDELMVKIEETKIKMNSKSSLKRVSVQVHNSLNQARFKHDSSETERLYNEAFPSLNPISTSNNSLVGQRPGRTGTDNSWDTTRSRQHAESSHSVDMFSSQEEADACHTARQVFVSALAENEWPSLEATEICPSQWMDNLFCNSFQDVCTYWSVQSAFQTCTLLKRFVPKNCPLQSADQPASKSTCSLEFSPIVIPVIQQSHLQTVHLDPSYEKTLSDHPQLFRPIKEPSAYDPSPMSDTDMEVDSVFSASRQKEQPLVIKSSSKRDSFATGTTFDGGGDCENTDWKKVSAGSPYLRYDSLEDDFVLTGSVLDILRVTDETPDKRANIVEGDICPRLTETSQAAYVSIYSQENKREVRNVSQYKWKSLEECSDTCPDELDEACAFPDHFGAFWKILTDTGSVALYPVMANEQIFDLEGRFKINHPAPVGHITEHVPEEGTVISSTEHASVQGPATDSTIHEQTSGEHYCDPWWPDVACGQWLLEQAYTQVQCFYTLQQLARVQWEHNSCLNQASLLHLLVPSFSSSYLSSQASQFLQRAFVNIYFSKMYKEAVPKPQPVNIPGYKCSDLEKCWLSTKIEATDGSMEQAQPEVVPGCTCSSWLENNCHLGEACPFSHPSI